MKLLDKLVLKDVVPMFGVGVAMFFSFWFVADPLIKAGKYLAQGIPFWIIVKLMELSVPPVLALTFPMGMLLAVLIGFGRISSDGETVALYAGGVPFYRIAAPAAVMSVIVSLFGFWINDSVAATAQKQLVALQKTYLQQGIGNVQSFHDEVRKDGKLLWTVQIEGVDVDTKQLKGVTIMRFTDGVPTSVVHARAALWIFGEHFTLNDVDMYNLGTFTHLHWPTLSSDHDVVKGSMEHNPSQIVLLSKDPNSFTFHELRGLIKELTATYGANSSSVREAQLALWSKIAFPLSSIVFAMIGSPLGLQKQRRSSKTGWGLSLVIVFAYYIIYQTMSSVARGGACSPALAAFIPDIIGLCVGIFLSWRASA